MSIFFLKIKMKHFQWEKKINRTCLNKGGWGCLVFFFFCKEQNKEDLLVGKINPFTDGLAVSLSAQAYAPLFPGPFPSLPAELVLQRMPPGSLPPSTAQEGSSPATLLTPVVTRVQNPSSHRTQCWQKQDFPKHSYSLFPSFPTRKITKPALCYYFRAFFPHYYSPFTMQHRSTARVAGERWVFLTLFAMATFVLDKSLRHMTAARPKVESYFARARVCSSPKRAME